MCREDFINTLLESKLIIVVKEEKYIDDALESKAKVVFFLTGNITNLKVYVEAFKKKGKMIFVHVEMVGGLNCDRQGLEFVAKYVKPTGIISTRKAIITAAKKMKLLTVQRIFAIDTDAVNSCTKVINEVKPDLVEIMPARIPEIISEIKHNIDVPVITGGLIRNKEHMITALEHGAIAVATGTVKLWKESL